MHKNTTTVIPVIHYLTDALALENAALAFDAGAQGVMLISMEGIDDPVIPAAQLVKSRWPDKLVGVNLLTLTASESLALSLRAGLDATWTDRPGVTSANIGAEAFKVAEMLKANPRHLFFGSVAFKYQAPEPQPDVAAKRANSLGMVACTSGMATGVAPDLEKTALMKRALGDCPLALASGVTPENITSFLGDVTYFLVATGISIDEHRFDAHLCKLLMARALGSDAIEA